MKQNKQNIGYNLNTWYKQMKYAMPWRSDKNPYKVWISEIMLQQTQVNTVKQYYITWMNQFPSVNDVAKADIDSILKVWEGLGYYKRAHNIHDSSKIILKKFNGKIPDNYNDLIALKGIGDYTASAILSIAFNKPFPVFDGNIKRVISRFHKLKDKKIIVQKSQNTIRKCMEIYSPNIINEALMDLGREICTPQKPRCEICPINFTCKAYNSNLIHIYPPKQKKIKKPIYDVAVGLIWKNNKMLISKRKKNKLLGGLWELPGGKKNKKENLKECLKRELLEELDIKVEINKKIGIIKHQYSHFGINMTGYTCNYKQGKVKALTSEKNQWIKFQDISNFAFPRATTKLFELYEKNYQ